MTRVFAAPLVLAVISAVGLVAAFAFGATGPVRSWLGVGAPIAVIAWFGLPPLKFNAARRPHRYGQVDRRDRHRP